MRTFVSAAAVLIGLLMAAVAVPAIWVDRNIVQEDGFVALAAPAGQGPRVPAAARHGRRRQPRFRRPCPEALAGLVRPVLEAAQSLTGLPGYPDAWAETLQQEPPAELRRPGTLPPEADGATSLTLDVAPLVGLVAKQVSRRHQVAARGPGPGADHT